MALRLAQQFTDGVLKPKFLGSIQWCYQQTFDFKGMLLSNNKSAMVDHCRCYTTIFEKNSQLTSDKSSDKELKRNFALQISEKARKRHIRLKKKLRFMTQVKSKEKPVVKLAPANSQVIVSKPPDIIKYFAEYKSRHMLQWQPSKLVPFGQKINLCHKPPPKRKIELVYPTKKKFNPGK